MQKKEVNIIFKIQFPPIYATCEKLTFLLECLKILNIISLKSNAGLC